jgi:hypothetical protein
MSRPSSFSQQMADDICRRLADGESLRQICRDDHMPDRATVFRWLDANEGFATEYARARERQGDHMDDLILEAAEACTSENAQAVRVKILAYQWRASKLRPRVYGEKVQNEISGPGGGPIKLTWNDGSV